jgi:hypothetical protein
MIALIWLGTALAGPSQASDGLRLALDQELARSLTLLHLPGEPPPYWVGYDVLQGQVATVYAESGAVLSRDHGPHRQLRVEVRCGGPDFDSGNFDALGEPDGVVVGGLPLEDEVLALRREIWLYTDRAYKNAVEQLSRKSAELTVQELPGPAQAPITPLQSGPVDPKEVDPERLESLVTHLSGLLANDPAFEEVVAAGRDWQGTRMTLTSEGTAIERPTGYTVLRIEAVLRTLDGTRVRDGRWWVARTVDDLPSLADLEAQVHEMGDWLRDLAQAPVLEDWLGPVLFEGPAAIELFRQLVAPEVVGTPPPREGRGPFGPEPAQHPRARVGRRLLPTGWTVVDEPRAEAAGQMVLDHEGVPSQRTVLVEDGVVRRLLQSRVPSGDSPASTGHARAAGADRRVAITTNVSVVPHKTVSSKALEKKALRLAAQTGQDRVLVIRRLEPPAMTEDFDVHFTGEGPPPGLTPPYEAWLLYADGRREPVRSMVFHGVDRRVLRDIVLAGEPSGWMGVMDEVPGPERFLIGAVGGMPAAWSVPSVLISELELHGASGGEPRVIPPPPVAPSE